MMEDAVIGMVVGVCVKTEIGGQSTRDTKEHWPRVQPPAPEIEDTTASQLSGFICPGPAIA